MADERITLRRETVEALAELLDNEAQGYARVTQARNIARLLREDAGERFYPESPKPQTPTTALPVEVRESCERLRNALENHDPFQSSTPLVKAATEMVVAIEAASVQPPKPKPERVGAVAKRVYDARVAGRSPEYADVARLLACAEASDAKEASIFKDYEKVMAWRRTVTGSD